MSLSPHQPTLPTQASGVDAGAAGRKAPVSQFSAKEGSAGAAKPAPAAVPFRASALSQEPSWCVSKTLMETESSLSILVHRAWVGLSIDVALRHVQGGLQWRSNMVLGAGLELSGLPG